MALNLILAGLAALLVVVGVVMMCCLYGGACGLLCHVFLAIIIIVDRMNSASVM